MKLATLYGVDSKRQRFFYRLSRPYFVSTLDSKTDYWTDTFEIFSDERSLWVVSDRDHNIIKTMGMLSHAQALENYGYTRIVDHGWMLKSTDDVVLACILEFEKTQDEVMSFEREYGRR